MPFGLKLMAYAWAFVIVWITIVILTQRKHHPKALFILFFTELWERFSYYGMRSLLVLYMIKAMLYTDTQAYGIYGAYVALVYATPVLGGILADKILGSRNGIWFGALIMSIGHFAMAFEYEPIFFLALGFLIVGNGFFKPNISTLIGKLYPEGDPRRDSAFTIFYMGINTGAFLTPLTCGFVGETYGWHYGFGIAGVGMLLGLLIFTYGNIKGAYGDKGLPVSKELTNKKVLPGLSLKNFIYLVAFISAPVFALLVNQNRLSSFVLYFVIAAVVIYLLVLSFRENEVQKNRLWVILVLFVFTIMFWTFFELAGSVITLFTDRNVNKVFLGMKFETSMFQAVNPLFIIVLAPIFSWLWEKVKNFSAPAKFSIALMQLGLGFGFLVLGAKSADANGMVPLVFLVLAYLFHTTGELCLSPIGLSLVTKLSPDRIVAFVMGTWMLSSSMAGLLGAEISKLTSIPESAPGEAVSALSTLPIYTNVFEVIAYVAFGMGVILVFLTPLLKKWMHGIN